MCLGEAGRIVEIVGQEARVETVHGVEQVSLAVPRAQGLEPAPGDWALISLGMVLELLDDVDGRQLAADQRRIRDELLLRQPFSELR